MLSELAWIGGWRGTGAALDFVEAGCLTMALIDESFSLTDAYELYPWTQGGGESYVTAARLVFEDGSSGARDIRIIGKAYAGFSDPARQVSAWDRRACALAAASVPVVHSWGCRDGIWFSEYVAFELVAFLRKHGNAPGWLLADLLSIARGLDRLGVRPTRLLADIRTDGFRAVLTDMGEDIGGVPDGPTSFEDPIRRGQSAELLVAELRSRSFYQLAAQLESTHGRDSRNSKA